MSHSRKCVAVWLGSLAILGLIHLGGGCGDGDDGAGPGNGTGGGTVLGSAGGTVASADSNATLVVPPGALSQDVTFTISPASTAPAGALSGTAYDFGPTGTAFITPATLSLGYDPANLPAGTAHAALRLSRAESGVWTPLADSAVDSVAFTLAATTSHLSTYGITTAGGGTPADSATAYLKDDPTPGAENEFDSLSAAVAWLGSRLGSEDLGVIVWQTNTAQAVTSLAFLFDLRIDVDAGYTPALEGPASDPLVIDAAGAVELSAFEIQAPGGFVLNANRNVSLGGCTLPDVTTVNIGGVKGAAFPAAEPGALAKSAAAERRARGATIFANQFGQDLNVNFTGGGTIEGNYTLENNSGDRLNVGGSAVLGGSSVVDVCKTPAAPSPIPIPYPNIAPNLSGDAKVQVRGLTQVQVLTVNPRLDGQNTVKLEKIEGNEAAVNCSGVGRMKFVVPSVKVELLLIDVGTIGAEIQADSLEATTVNVTAASGKALSDAQVQLNEATISGTLEVDLMGASGPIDLGLQDCDLQDCWFYVPEGADVSLDASGGSVEGVFYLGPDFKRVAAAPSGLARGSVSIDGLTWSGSGADHVDLNRLSSPVSVTGCTFSYSGDPALAVGLTEIGGSITVRGNTFTNMGLGLVDCTGSATIQENEVSVTASTGYGISLGTSASTSISDCTVNCAGGANAIQTGSMNGSVNISGCTIVGGTAALVVGGSNVTCDGNAQITGMITIADGQLHFAGNTCSGVMLIDDYVTPGLQNDPVPDNDGLSPNDVMTRMDWDGNGCCDYPPEWNMKVNGECVCDGVSGKAASW